MVHCSFENIELLDGSFSAVATIDDDMTRYIFNLDYDIELDLLNMWNCGDIYYNSSQMLFSPEKIYEIKNQYFDVIMNEINFFLLANREPIFADRTFV